MHTFLNLVNLDSLHTIYKYWQGKNIYFTKHVRQQVAMPLPFYHTYNIESHKAAFLSHNTNPALRIFKLSAHTIYTWVNLYTISCQPVRSGSSLMLTLSTLCQRTPQSATDGFSFTARVIRYYQHIYYKYKQRSLSLSSIRVTSAEYRRKQQICINNTCEPTS